METRHLTKKEMIPFQMLQSIAFLYPIDIEALRKKEAEAPEEELDYRYSWGSFDERGTLTSGLYDWPMSIYYDGHVVGMGGIGGVVSAPEARMKGGIRAIFQKVFAENRENGVLFSVLFPFSHRYYRQFGYELCHEGRRAHLPTESLKKYKNTADVRMYNPNRESDAAFREVYAAFASRYNYAAARDDRAWKDVLHCDPYKAEAYPYILSRDGKDIAYCIFKTYRGEEPSIITLETIDYAYVDQAALRDLLGFLYRMAAQCKYILMELPDDVDLSSLVDEAYDVTYKAPVRTMARVLDAERALRLMRHPEGEGAYSVYVRDDFLPENTGAYHVQYDNKVARVERKAGNACDLSLDVQTLAQLCLGHASLDMAAYRPDVTIAANRDALEKVFVRKDKFLFDRF